MVNVNNNFNVIPWYSSLAQQNHRKWYAFDKQWPLIMPNTRFLPFQFVLENTPANISSITVYSEDKSVTRNLGITPVAVPNTEKGYCVVMLYPEICNFTDALPEGRYYATLTVDGETLYSEVFTVVSNIGSYLKLTYWNTDTLYYKNGEINYANDFQYEMYLDTTIGKPEYEFSEELTTRLGYKFLESQISNKLYKFVFLGPEFICDAMRLIRLSDYIKLESGRDSYNAISFSYEPSWETQGDLASIEVSFETDTIIQKLPSFNRNQRENFYNALLTSTAEPLLYDEGLIAQYYTAYSDAITGKLTRQLAEANVEEITEETVIPIDQGLGAAQQVKLLPLLRRYASTKSNGDSALEGILTRHIEDNTRHIAASDRDRWNTISGWFDLRETSDGTKVLYTKYGIVSEKDFTAGAEGAGGDEDDPDSGVTTLGGLLNVDSIVDEVPAEDVVLFRAANATHWGIKKLSELAGLDKSALANYLEENGYITEDELDSKGFVTEDWVLSKGYATNTAVATLQLAHNTLRSEFDALNNVLNDDVSGKINTWNEVVDFLDEYSGSQNLATILAGINGNISTLQGYFTNGVAKQAAKVTNALTFGSKTYDGSAARTITASDLGAITSHQDISHLLSKTEAANTYQPKGNYLTAIPSEYITDSELSSKGFATQSWVTQQAYLSEISASDIINALGYLPVSADDISKAALISTLGIADWALAASKPSYAWGEITGKPSFAAVATSGKYSDLLELPTIPTYNFTGASFTSGNSGQGAHDCNTITSNGHWYYGANGPSTSIGATTADGALYTQAYSDIWVAQIAQDYRNGNLFTRGKSNGSWTAWKAVSYNGHTHTKSQITDFPTSLPASDVYAWAKAATKPSYSWSEITSKPTIPSAVTEATVSGWGFTKNIGTVTGVKINGATQTATNGVVDLGTVLTAHQSLSAYATKSWVQQQNYLTSVPGEYITSTELSSTLESYQNKITSSNKLDYSLLKNTPTIPTALKSPYALTFGSKTYDGSAAKTIVASDLGALTAHQSIYALTFSAGVFSAGTFTANSAAKTINIPTHTSHLTNNSGFITSSSIPTTLKNPYALTINNSAGTAQVSYDGSAAKSLTLTKAMVGLGNVDNTADSAKNVKYATAAGSVTFSNGQTLSVHNDGTVYLTGNLAVEGEISTGGISDDTAGSSSYTRLDSWDDYNASAGDVLSATLGYGLKMDIEAIDGRISNLQSQIDALGSGSGGSVSGDYLPLTGGTLTGNITVKGTNTGYMWARASDGAALGRLETDGTNLMYRSYLNLKNGQGFETVLTSSNFTYWAVDANGPELYADLYSFAGGTFEGPVVAAYLEAIEGAAFSNLVYISGDLFVEGEFQYSDMRYKNVVENIFIPNDVIAEAPIFRYHWADKLDNKMHIGTSAQYWEEYDSSFVSADPRSGKLGLNYLSLAVAMGQSNASEIRELKREIVKLKEKLAAYEQ